MVTENELLKERLADAKASFAGAAEREAAAKERSAGVAQVGGLGSDLGG